MSDILERIRNPKARARRPIRIWLWVCGLGVALSGVTLIGDPWFWQLSEHKETLGYISFFGWMILFELELGR